MNKENGMMRNRISFVSSQEARNFCRRHLYGILYIRHKGQCITFFYRRSSSWGMMMMMITYFPILDKSTNEKWGNELYMMWNRYARSFHLFLLSLSGLDWTGLTKKSLITILVVIYKMVHDTFSFCNNFPKILLVVIEFKLSSPVRPGPAATHLKKNDIHFVSENGLLKLWWCAANDQAKPHKTPPTITPTPLHYFNQVLPHMRKYDPLHLINFFFQLVV